MAAARVEKKQLFPHSLNSDFVITHLFVYKQNLNTCKILSQ